MTTKQSAKSSPNVAKCLFTNSSSWGLPAFSRSNWNNSAHQLSSETQPLGCHEMVGCCKLEAWKVLNIMETEWTLTNRGEGIFQFLNLWKPCFLFMLRVFSQLKVSALDLPRHTKRQTSALCPTEEQPAIHPIKQSIASHGTISNPSSKSFDHQEYFRINHWNLGVFFHNFLYDTWFYCLKDSFHESTFISIHSSSILPRFPRDSSTHKISYPFFYPFFQDFAKSRLRLHNAKRFEVWEAREEICDAKRWDATFLHHQLCGFILH